MNPDALAVAVEALEEARAEYWRTPLEEAEPKIHAAIKAVVTAYKSAQEAEGDIVLIDYWRTGNDCERSFYALPDHEYRIQRRPSPPAPPAEEAP